MLLAHVLATAATAVTLCLQDRAAARVVAWLNRGAPVGIPIGVGRVRVLTHVTDELPKRLRVCCCGPLRGPPAGVLITRRSPESAELCPCTCFIPCSWPRTDGLLISDGHWPSGKRTGQRYVWAALRTAGPSR